MFPFWDGGIKSYLKVEIFTGLQKETVKFFSLQAVIVYFNFSITKFSLLIGHGLNRKVSIFQMLVTQRVEKRV